MASGSTRRLTLSGLASLVVVTALVAQSHAAIVGTYVDAKALEHTAGGPGAYGVGGDPSDYHGTLNTTPSSSFAPNYADSFGDLKWDDRGLNTVGLNSAGTMAAPDQNIIEAGSSDLEIVTTITTSVTGLATDTYKIYVLYWVLDAANWGVRAKLSTDASFVLYDDGGLGVAGVDTGIGSGAAHLYEALIGTVTGTSFSVNIQNTTAGNSRTWYDGVAYQAPEPASIALIFVALPFAARRRSR